MKMYLLSADFIQGFQCSLNTSKSRSLQSYYQSADLLFSGEELLPLQTRDRGNFSALRRRQEPSLLPLA